MKMEAIIVYEDGSNSVHCFCIIYRLEVKKSRITRLETYNCRAWFEANTLPERNLYSGGGYEISRTLRLLYLIRITSSPSIDILKTALSVLESFLLLISEKSSFARSITGSSWRLSSVTV